MRFPTVIAALIALLGTAHCSKGRSQEGTPTNRVSWEEEIAPLFASKCTSCHSGANPAGGYQTTSYLAALGPTDAPVAAASDPDSLLLRTIDPAHANANHAPVSDAYQTARAWVVDGRLSLNRSGLHEGGILNANDPYGEFHGSLLRSASWNFAVCQDCHGTDFKGGRVDVSCFTCHSNGPTACDTCHGQPPRSGAHTVHTSGAVGRKLDCSECHVKPASYNDPGHLLTADGKPKDKATVTFAAQAALPGPGRGGAPTWDGATCSNVYCHGAAFQDSKATHISPKWTGGSTEAACGTCHGLPPANHDAKYASNPVCSSCHKLTAHPGGGLSPQFHVDGTLQLGDGSGTCSACHGNAQNPAPPFDLSGNTATAALGVGAHQAHLTNPQRLTGPIACSACHVVPEAVESPGHLDSPPAEVTFGGLAVTDGAAATWDRTTATCTSYCHGGGEKLAADTNFKLRKPVWTLGVSQAFCGSCHGVPPSTPAHRDVKPFDFQKCSDCHPNTVARDGTIIVSGPPGAQTSRHINGKIDVGP